MFSLGCHCPPPTVPLVSQHLPYQVVCTHLLPMQRQPSRLPPALSALKSTFTTKDPGADGPWRAESWISKTLRGK